MKSIKSLYKIGHGPSSSHTMGPNNAAKLFISEYPEADFVKVILYGSLSKTGKGHMTDEAIKAGLGDTKSEIIFSEEETNLIHPNTMEFSAYKNNKNRLLESV